jgi:hypothetical protein
MFLTFNDPKNTAGPRVGSHLLRSSRGLAENQKTHPTRLRSLAPGRILPQGCRVRNVNSGVRRGLGHNERGLPLHRWFLIPLRDTKGGSPQLF